jgi:putative transcriptional regulator
MSKLFEDLSAGLNEAINFAQGARNASKTRVNNFFATEIQDARLKTGLTQKQFADVIGSSVATVRKWEQGSRKPSGAAETLIKVIAYRPSIVKEALGVTPQPAKRRPRNVSA